MAPIDKDLIDKKLLIINEVYIAYKYLKVYYSLNSKMIYNCIKKIVQLSKILFQSFS